jgi:hypothetical protein
MNIIRKIYTEDGSTLLAVVVDELPANCEACEHCGAGVGNIKAACKITDLIIRDTSARPWHCPLKDADFPLK